MYEHVKLVFCAFSLLLIWSFIYSGKRISRVQDDKSYWKLATLPIIVFTLFYGLRFGRLVDYNLYAVRYYSLGNHLDDEYELLFRYVCHWGASLGIHYQFLILLITFLVIFSFFCFVKDVVYRRSLLYILIVFLLVIPPIEQLVRWYFAAAFYIFAIFFFLKSDYIKFGVFSLCACLTHIGYIPLLAFFIVIYFIHIQLIPAKLCLILLVVSVLFGSTQFLENLTPYVSMLSMNDKSAMYVEGFSSLVTEGTQNIGIREYRITTQIRTILANSFPLFFLQDLKKEGIKMWIINTYCIAILIGPIFSTVEILDRYASLLVLISYPVIIGGAFKLFFLNYFNFKYPMRIFGIISFISNVFPILSGLFGRDDWWYMLFIWDANGRDILPVSLFR